jgi:hypothetical protein
MHDGMIVTVDASTAMAWLALYETDVQRDLRPGRVAELAAIMQAGKWLPLSDIHIGLLDDRYHLIDGQQRLHAIVKSGLPQVLRVNLWQVNSRAELVERSEALNNTKRHTLIDRLKTRNNIGDLGLSNSEIARVKSAFVFIDNRFNGGNAIPLFIECIEEMMQEYASSARAYLDVTRSAKGTVRDAMRWGVTIALGLVTFQESAVFLSSAVVGDFWHDVSQMINATPGDPRGMAADFLIKYQPPNSNGSKPARSHAYIARYLARCFNAWAVGETLKAVRVDEDKPICIMGSQFKG